MYKKSIFVIILLVSIISVWNSCSKKGTVSQPRAIQGILDLRDWDESSSQIITLDGEWEFYWEQLIKPSQFTKGIKPFTYIEVPKPWNKQGNFRYSFPAAGYATYRLKIIHNPRYVGQIKTLNIPFVHTAYTLWVNGKVISTNGKVGTSNSEMVPFQIPVIAQFVVDSAITEVVLHISNFQQRTGGILRSIRYGNYNIISKQYEIDLFINLFVLAALFVILLYHFGLYIINREYKPNLYFSAFCAIIALRILLTDQKLFVKIFPFLPWDLYLRLEYYTIICAIVVFAHFVDTLIPQKTNKLVLKIIDIYFGLFFIFVLLSPIIYVSYSLIYIQLGLFLSALYLAYILLTSVSLNSTSSIIYVGGVIILVFALVNDILYSQQILNSIYLFPMGLLIFVFTQSLLALEESIKMQNRLISINSELEIARRIQKTILPESCPSTPAIHIEACYIPMDEIGGDFYHFYELDIDKIGILVADVTGHGIPASLIASTVNIAFSLQRNYAEHPDVVLSNMNNVLYGKTGGQPITALYAYIDAKERVVKFSRAGHPLPLIWKAQEKKIIEVEIPGKILGVFKNIATNVSTYTLNSQDKVILYTDGIIEIRNSKNQVFGIENLISYFKRNYNKNSREIIDDLIDIVIQWAGSKDRITDDITIVIAEIL